MVDSRETERGGAEAPRRRRLAQAAFVAGVFALGLFGGYQLAPGQGGASPVVYEAGSLVAAGPLEHVLYDPAVRAPGEGPAADNAFAGPDGRSCRRFRDGKVEGLACQTGGDWRVLELRQK